MATQSIEAIVERFLLELGNFRDMAVPVKGMVSVEPISVL
jgi:hypothetical protein